MLVRPTLFLLCLLAGTLLTFDPAHKPVAESLVQENYPVLEDHIQKSSAGADFTYQSRVSQTTDKKYKLESSVKNSGGSPLSVKWKDAGITCTGFLQLPSGQTDYGTSKGVVEKPSLVNSTIEYGNGLQYSAPARMYIDPQPKQRDQSTAASGEYRRVRADGVVVFSIEVISTLNQANNESTVRFVVTGGMTLAISREIGPSDFSTAEYSPNAWSLAEVGSLDNYLWSNSDSATRWLGYDSNKGFPKGEERFLLMKNRIDTNNQFVVTLTAERWTAERVRVIGFVPGKEGFVGMTTDIFLPFTPR